MHIVFLNKHLKELYDKGSSKKYKSITGKLLDNYLKAVNQLESANDIYDLRNAPSLNFEKMQGHEKRFSLRINIKWRLEVEIDWENKEKTVGIIGIDEISSHYRS